MCALYILASNSRERDRAQREEQIWEVEKYVNDDESMDKRDIISTLQAGLILQRQRTYTFNSSFTILQ